jgi:hypothetical protein
MEKILMRTTATYLNQGAFDSGELVVSPRLDRSSVIEISKEWEDMSHEPSGKKP